MTLPFDHALVLATGMAVRELEVPGISPLVGAGVYYGAARKAATSHNSACPRHYQRHLS